MTMEQMMPEEPSKRDYQDDAEVRSYLRVNAERDIIQCADCGVIVGDVDIHDRLCIVKQQRRLREDLDKRFPTRYPHPERYMTETDHDRP